jgi:hypothetical protein
MGIKFGEIDATQILDNEYRSRLALALLEWLVRNNPGIVGITDEVFKDLQKKVIKDLQKKYPNSGIQLIND